MTLGTLSTELVIGVISDTHDHLYPEVKELLDGVDHIIHAGDICTPQILSRLRTIAPVTAVRGNCDFGAWADRLPLRAEVELGGLRILVGHIGGGVKEAAAARAAQPPGIEGGRVDVVVFGHSHQALVEKKDGVLYLNPGSAGPRRYGRPRTMAMLRIRDCVRVTAGAGLEPTSEASADIVVVEA